MSCKPLAKEVQWGRFVTSCGNFPGTTQAIGDENIAGLVIETRKTFEMSLGRCSFSSSSSGIHGLEHSAIGTKDSWVHEFSFVV